MIAYNPDETLYRILAWLLRCTCTCSSSELIPSHAGDKGAQISTMHVPTRAAKRRSVQKEDTRERYTHMHARIHNRLSSSLADVNDFHIAREAMLHDLHVDLGDGTHDALLVRQNSGSAHGARFGLLKPTSGAALAESVATASGPRLHGLSHLEADRTCDEEVVRTQAPPRNCARTDRYSEARMGCTGVACKQWATRHFECVAKWLHLHLLRS